MQAAAHGETLDCADDQLVSPLQKAQGLIPPVEIAMGRLFSRQLLEVDAGTERPPIAPDERGSGVGVVVDRLGRLGQTLRALVVDGVQDLGPLQRETDQVAIRLVLHGF